MWEWQCPSSSGVISVHHNKADALAMLVGHLTGLNEPGLIEIKACPLPLEDHRLVDTGVPCSWRNCKIPYVR